MMLGEQVYAQAAVLAGELESEQRALLDALCMAATASLAARLRDGLTPEDCKADFIAAASLFALAAMNASDNTADQVTAGDLMIRRRDADAASHCLFNQAMLLIAPYLKDNFCFRGV